jgi:ADP-ribose pyrophosphatase
MKAWKRIEPTLIKKVGWRTITTKRFIMPNQRVHDFALVGTEDEKSVGVIALTPDRRVIIARQFRPGPEKIMEELPGGIVDPGESPKAAAVRELQEETGYYPGNIELLGAMHKDAYSNGVWYYYLARDCVKNEEGQKLDDNEFIEIDLITVGQLVTNARSGRMTDAEAVLLAYEQLTAAASF